MLSLSLLSCGGPEAEIRAGLSAAERETFDRGQRLSTPCWSCHDLYGEQNKVGPYLAGVYGRKAGSANFPGYSEAMKDSGVVWNERSLRAFLLNTNGFIPGTNMVSSGPQSSSDVGALVFYLMHVTRAVATQ
jgi:cytochrome c